MRYRPLQPVVAFALVVALSSAMVAPASASSSAGRAYLGKQRDPAFGFHDLGHRWYDPGTQRFLSMDPVFWEMGRGTPDSLEALHDSQMQNPFSYAGGNPLRFLDFDGRKKSEHQSIPPANGASYRVGELMGTYKGVPLYAGARDLNGPTNTQCVASVKRIYGKSFGVDLNYKWGNAIGGQDIHKKVPSIESHPQNGPNMPQEDDIIIWAGGKNGDGHTAVVAEVEFNSGTGSGTVWTVDQNRSTTKTLFPNTLTRNGDGTYRVDGLNGYQVVSWQRRSSGQSAKSAAGQVAAPAAAGSPAAAAPQPSVPRSPGGAGVVRRFFQSVVGFFTRRN